MKRFGLIKAARGGILGTKAMTAFSGMASKVLRENFNEAELISDLLLEWNPKMKPSTAEKLGRDIHFGIGIGWAILYLLLKKKRLPLSSPLAFGSLIGATSILVWRKALSRSSKPPPIDRKKFYQQLFLAHLIFSLTLQRTALISPSSKLL